MLKTPWLLALVVSVALAGCGKKDDADADGDGCTQDCSMLACGPDPVCNESCGECGGAGACGR